MTRSCLISDIHLEVSCGILLPIYSFRILVLNISCLYFSMDIAVNSYCILLWKTLHVYSFHILLLNISGLYFTMIMGVNSFCILLLKTLYVYLFQILVLNILCLYFSMIIGVNLYCRLLLKSYMEYLGCICALSTCHHRNMDEVEACRHVSTLVINGVI